MGMSPAAAAVPQEPAPAGAESRPAPPTGGGFASPQVRAPLPAARGSRAGARGPVRAAGGFPPSAGAVCAGLARSPGVLLWGF